MLHTLCSKIVSSHHVIIGVSLVRPHLVSATENRLQPRFLTGGTLIVADLKRTRHNMDHKPDHAMPATLFKPTTGRNTSSKRAVMLQHYLAIDTGQLDNTVPDCDTVSLSTNSTMGASPEMSSSEPSSARGSPILTSTQFSQISPPAYALPRPILRKHSSKSPEVATIPENDSLDEFELPNHEQSKHYNIDHDLKTTLTDLLNCDAVRSDPKLRLSIQSRLMESERELKRQRRCRQRQTSLPTPTIVLSRAEDEHRRGSLP
ncbi:hypothetical protein DOTSEDRAFT_81483 [Dothistroma septosporum NZE10]|uniref:Uncharacterized protein n=1 Tax=Dothistroma septosporum (strain NZE10 / CBS 128990) TaxID=675120 RepID=N1PJF1_DOTSN|nr:hypothetical protein DOTSEDRAFT_81483 [Dothistroma septosporum NZE10]